MGSGLFQGLLIAGALGALARLLSPEEGTRKILRLCTALFLVVTLGAGFRDVSMELETQPANDVQDTAAEAVLRTAQQAVEQQARRVLDAHGLYKAQVRVQMTVRDGEVHTQSFVLYGVPPESAQEIQDEIFANTGERPLTSARAAPQP